MNKIIVRIGLFLLLSITLSSCTPKVFTNVLKNYPPLPEETKITIYEREKGDSVPAHAETLGNIVVVDNGFSVSGSYEKVKEMASNETRKSGGNSLLITDHLRPSFWGSSIHQIGGIMLRTEADDSVFVSSVENYTSLEENRKKNYIDIPVHTFYLNGGFGSLLTHTKGIQGEAKKMEDKLNNGFSWDAQYYYHHKGLPYGFGLMASQFYSSPFEKVIYENMIWNNRLNYFAVSLGLKKVFSQKFIWGISFGMGYLEMIQNISNANSPSLKGRITGGTLGIHYGAEIAYRLSKHFGIGLDMSLIGGSLSSVEYHNITRDSDAPEINNENRIGLSRININLGARYYF